MMFYRIVLQGCTAGGHDLATVKREFVRVTGMPQDVTERLFAETPQPLKERVEKADAERIAATLRAIGAAVTVEHDRVASLVNVEDGVQELLPPEHRGPPTVIPGSEPVAAPAPAGAARGLHRRLQPHLRYLVGIPLVVVAAVVLKPFADEAYRVLRPAETPPAAPARKPEAETPAQVARAGPGVLHGPWRCTDQRTGLSAYWTFAADGTLIYHGDTYREGLAPIQGPEVATGWRLVDGEVIFTFAQQSPARYATTDLNISRLRYGDGGDVDVQCRRP